MKVIHSLLKEYLGDSTPAPEKVDELLTFHAFEIDGVESLEGEDVIDVDVLPNRASDSLSHRGIARELATILDTSLTNDPLSVVPEFKSTDLISVKISEPKICPRFIVSLINGVEVKDSPEWLQKRLRALGQRPINNIVDATNYVMFTIGQPLHAYDADLFSQSDGKWKFDIRLAKEGETVSLLAEGNKDEDRVVELKGTELLIVDGSTDVALGLAGIKGGRSTGVHAGTKNILIEAAHFDPINIRKTARGLGIVTEATKRFENEPSRELPAFAQQEIIKLITDIAGGASAGTVDEYLSKKEAVAVKVSLLNTNRLLGLNLNINEVKTMLERTGSAVEVIDGGSLKATGPWERKDLTSEVEFIEEVARLHGLNNIESVSPEVLGGVSINARHYYSEKIRQALIGLGFSEVINSSFQKKGKVQLQNALASDKSCMRQNLTKKMHENLDANFTHTDLLGMTDVKVFEIGTVFSKTETGIGEHVAIAIGVRTKGGGYNPKDDVTLKVACDALKTELGGEINWTIEKGVAEVSLTDLIAKLPEPTAYEAVPEQPEVTFQAVSPYPAIARDIALWVNEDESAEVVSTTLADAAGELRVRHDLFDTFTKDGRTSYAFRFVFQAKDRTLTDEEINPIMESLYKVAKEKDWEVR